MSTLNIHEAGDLMNVHPKTVLDLISKGALPAGKVGRAYILLTRDVMNYIENTIIRQTAERMGVPHRRPLPSNSAKTQPTLVSRNRTA